MLRATCQCGEATANALKAPDFVIACNCIACQRRTGGPFGVGGYFLKTDIEFAGKFKTWARGSDSGRGIVNHFCPTCATTLYWTLDMRPDHVGVAAGCFVDPLPEPARAIWTEAKHDWVHFPEHWPQFPKGTPET